MVGGKTQNKDVYYELSSSNNDVTESEEEEDEHLTCIKIEENESLSEDKDEFEELREKLAENSNFLHQTPPNCDNFEAAK